jgi:hypothetical protein
MALPVQDHSHDGVLYKRYCTFCHVSTVPFLNVGDVVGIQSKLKIWGTAGARPFTCWVLYQKYTSSCHIPLVPLLCLGYVVKIQRKLIVYGTMALLVQYHLFALVLYKEYPCSCDILAVPFLLYVML